MAKGRDDTEEYGPPKGHKIVEILNYMPDLRYRGKSDIKHLVSVYAMATLCFAGCPWRTLLSSVGNPCQYCRRSFNTHSVVYRWKLLPGDTCHV